MSAMALHAFIVLAQDKPGEGISTVVVTATGAAIAALFAALSPALVELIKRRTTGPKEPEPKPEQQQSAKDAVQSALVGTSMIETALADLRAQRDDVTQRYYEALDDLDDAREAIRQRDIRIAILEANPQARHHPPDQQNWDPHR